MFIFRRGLYFFKRDVKRRWAVCKFCGRRALLSSFNGYKLHHLIQPGERLHVDGHCTRCGRAHESEYVEWRPRQEAALVKAQERYEPDRSNYENAIKLHRTLELYGSESESRSFAGFMEKRFAGNIAVQYYLADFYRSACDYKRALPIYNLLETRSTEKGEFNYSLAHLFYEKGEFERALAYFQQAKRLRAPDDDMERLLNIAAVLRRDEQYFGARKVLDFIKSRLPERAASSSRFEAEMYKVGRKTGVLPPEYRYYRIKQLSLVAAFLFSISIVFTSIDFYLSRNQKLFLTNSLKREVLVTFRGNRRFLLEPDSLVESRISEGRHRVKVEIDGFNPYYRVITVKNSPLQRFKGNNLFVFNIKGASLLLRGEVVYSKRQILNEHRRRNFSLYAGREFQSFHDISFAFCDPPETYYFEEGKSEAIKTYLKMLETSGEGETLEMLLYYKDLIEREALLSYLERQLELSENEHFKKVLERLREY